MAVWANRDKIRVWICLSLPSFRERAKVVDMNEITANLTIPILES